MTFRKAIAADIPAIAAIYADIHTQEEQGLATIGWIRDVYPTKQTAQAALARGDLFVGEENGRIVGAAIINQQQVDSYKDGHWKFDVPDEQVMVLHTLVISPALARGGYGRRFVEFYEQYALSNGCRYLRIELHPIC